MPIQPNDMLAVSLPAAYLDFLLYAARTAQAAHEQSDPVIRALAGQMQAHKERADAADKLAAEAQQPANDPVAPPPQAQSPEPPTRRARKARTRNPS